MKFIFSLLFIIFVSSANINAADTNSLKFDNEQLNEFLKKNKLDKKKLGNYEKKFDITNLKPFIPLAIIIFALIIGLNKESSEKENNTKPKKSKNKIHPLFLYPYFYH